MTETELRQALEAYGLTPRGARVFLALVKRTDANASELVEDTGLPRATVYLDLESLRKGGLVSKWKKNGVAYFTPESLNKLSANLRQKEELISNALPFLKNFAGLREHGASIRVVEGREGVISVWEELLEAYRGGLRESYGFTNIAALIELMPRFFPKFLEEEAKYPVSVRLLMPEDAGAEAAIPQNPNMHIKHIPSTYAYPGEMSIYGDRVVFFHVEEQNPYALVIESAEVAQMQKKIFMLLWDSI